MIENSGERTMLFLVKMCEVHNCIDRNMNHQMTQRNAGLTGAKQSSGLSMPMYPWTGLVLGLGSLALAAPAFAHHPTGGKIPSNFIEGFLSGIGHPILGPDHFAFVIALGLVTVLFRDSLKKLVWIPVSFAIATLMGVGVHLMSLDISAAESIVASTLIVMGVLLVISDRLKASMLLGFGAIAGVFHGYAYGEAIVGSEMAPLMAYLAGLLVIQVAIAGGAFTIGQLVKSFISQQSVTIFRYSGLIFGAIGIVLLGNTFAG